MALDNIKQISIREYLAQKGIKPEKENERRGVYRSPLRKENNASFSVDYIRNVWFDHGLGKGGSIIDLVAEMDNCSIGNAIKKLEDSSFSFHGNKDIPSENSSKQKQTIIITKVIPLSNPALLAYLSERCINHEIARLHCSEVHYSVNGKPYFAIGYKNDNGGFELRNKYFKGCTSKAITSVKRGSDSCQLFEGFMDYLTFLTMKNWQNSPVDVIVLNSLSNLPKVQTTLTPYKSVATFLDNDEAGKKAVLELKKVCENINDQSFFYSKHKDLNEHLCSHSAKKIPVKKKSSGLKR